MNKNEIDNKLHSELESNSDSVELGIKLDDTHEDAKNADNLDFKWLDLEEKDERTIAEVLEDMQAEANGIAEAVAQLKQLLGGIEI